MIKRNEGFTILELLVVIVIIGILSTIFFWNLTTSLKKYELTDATNQIAANFRRARSISQKNSINTVISWPNSPFTTYSMTQGTTSTPMVVPNGATVVCTSGCGASKIFTYTAPYGEVQGITGAVFTVSSPATSLNITPMEIRVVGVTGKVIVIRQGS